MSPASAGRQVHGSDVARLLTGRAFRIECIDGTTGRGQVTSGHRQRALPASVRSGPEETDNAVVRVKGVEICLAWKQFGGGGDGCYPVSEEAGGRYRLSTGPLWCDISPKYEVFTRFNVAARRLTAPSAVLGRGGNSSRW